MAVSAAPSREAVEKVAKDFMAAISALDADAFVNCFADDGESHDPEGAPPNIGHDALRAYFNGMAGLIDSITLTPDALYVSGNSVAVPWTCSARGKNGKQADATGVDVIVVNAAGKIQEQHGYWDAEAFVTTVTS